MVGGIPWNAIPGECLCWPGVLDCTRISNNVLMRGFLSHAVSAQPPEGLETEVSHMDSWPWSPNKGFGYQDLGEHPWLAIFPSYSLTSLLRGVSTILVSRGEEAEKLELEAHHSPRLCPYTSLIICFQSTSFCCYKLYLWVYQLSMRSTSPSRE